jgi:hypothetical protein
LNDFGKPRSLAARASPGIFIIRRRDLNRRVIGDLNRSAESRKPMAAGPDSLAAANRHGQDGHAGFQGHTNRAGFELPGRPIRIAASAFRKNYDRAAFADPLQGTANRRRISSFQL